MSPANGSSPRVRGTPEWVLGRLVEERFIPACAGNAAVSSGAITRHPVHPRVCGERLVFRSVRFPDFGSSPRVRGTPECQTTREARVRFIPACAGNAEIVTRAPSHRTVHPRVCGERRGAGPVAFVGVGSSPRVRGTRLAALASPRARRFIPACAGNAAVTQGFHRRSPVHPRVCGERPQPQEIARFMYGSSPRVRGTQRARHDRRTHPRFIPACAGNAPLQEGVGVVRAVHPRVCGERTKKRTPKRRQRGSSPRVRGTLNS